ncbi:MAG: restriction endonuclease subunit S [Halobacteriota archaeon]
MECEFPQVKLVEVLKHRKDFITIDDFALYKRCTAKLHAKGIVLRDEIEGSRLKTKKQQLCKAGDFLVAEIDAKVGGFGIVSQELEDAIVSSHYFLFEVNEEKMERLYLNFFIKTRNFQRQIQARGSTNYAAIRPKHVLDLEIPIPSLKEQKRIVARIESVLAKVEEARRLRTEAVEEAEDIFNRISGSIYEGLSNKLGIEKLLDISEQITDGTHKTPLYVSEGVPFLSVKDITSGKISFSNAKYITRAEHKELIKRCKPEKDDVLLTKVGTTGYAKMIDVDREFSIFVSLCLIKLKRERALPKYIEHILNSNLIRKLSKQYTRGVGNKNLVLKFIKEFPIPVPPISEQRRIVAYLDSLQAKVDELKRLQAETEKELEELVPSILDKAFKGEL